ncbi:MAG TPA: hypothetical protein VM537_21020, partial [Anaerolineae bacterium]|nr:hypothetical protein [Anaerolineae bacterium]
WGLAAGLAVVVIWPAMWTDPLRAVQAVTGTATRHASTPHINSFWFGQVVRDPGLPFYLLSLAFRLTPVTGLGFLVVLPLLRQPGKRRSLLIGILSYLVLFVLVMSMAAKKFDRYILACFPAIDLLAALGIVGLLRGLARWRQLRLRTARLVVVCGAALVVLAQAAGTLPHHPYYLTYYNPLLGGGQRAVQTITVGWGEGVDQAVRYVNDKASASALRVATWGVAGVAPLFLGSTYVLDQRSEMLADYVILNVSDVQFGSPHTFEFYGQVEAEHVVRLHGVEYAWVYRNERYVETLGALEGLVGEQELVVFGGESKLSEEWPSERPSLVLDPKGDEADIAAALNEAAQPEGRVWLVEFAAERDEPDLARFQLDTHALREAEHMLPPMTVSSYRVLPETVFAPLLVESSPEVVFAGRLSLLGLALGDTELMASQSLGVVLRWQVTDAIDGDYTVFVHLLDRYEQRLSQHDELLVDGGGRPTSQWPPGEQHDMRFLVDIPADAVPGDYLLVAGLYRVDGDDRLWLDGMDGLQGDTAYPLAEVHIVAHPSSEE